MPKTRFQGVTFGLIMTYSMAYGMEIYNVAIKPGYNPNIGGYTICKKVTQIYRGGAHP